MSKTPVSRTGISIKGTAAVLAASLALCLPALSAAETIRVPVGQQAQQKSSLSRPSNGMKQSEVEAIYGKPLDWREAVGDPPISSWIYADFVVYFEYDEVIHTVLRPADQPLAHSAP